MNVMFWRRKRVLVIELHGLIAARTGTLNITSVGPLVDRAFRMAGRNGVVLLDVESPGGSPVQSDLIANRIRRRADENAARVIAVIGEVGASGGYWLACAADEIVANPMSIVGSIGVIGGGFGFEDAIARLGVKRRLYTAGQNKARLDPFTPERPEDLIFVHRLLDDLHERFKEWVRTRRGARLKGDDADVFDGGYMLGEQAIALGLVDRAGDLEQLVEETGGKKAQSAVLRPRRRGFLGRLPRLLAEAVLDVAEERSRPTLR